jgi:hypothetical protein
MLLMLISLFSLFFQQANTLDFGSLTTGDVTALRGTSLYSFEAIAGDTVYVSITSDDMDPFVQLFDPQETLLAEAEGQGALVGPITLEADGIYFINAGRPGWSDATGSFTILLDRADVQPIRNNANRKLESRNHVEFFQFEAEAGDLYSYQVQADNAVMTLLAPDGSLVFEEGFYESPEMPLSQMPVDGEYLLVVRTPLLEGVDFTLHGQTIQPTVLEVGDPITGEINRRAFFSFDSLAGKTWQLEAEFPEGGDGFMAVYYMTGRLWWDTQLVYDYDSGANGNPRIAPFIAPEDGTYYVMLDFTSYESDVEAVEYTLSFRPGTQISLAPDAEIVETISAETGNMAFTYNGTAGEIISIRLTRLSQAGSPGISVFSPENEIANFTGYAARSATFELELAFDGLYLFTVWDASYSGEEMTFSLMLTSIK